MRVTLSLSLLAALVVGIAFTGCPGPDASSDDAGSAGGGSGGGAGGGVGGGIGGGGGGGAELDAGEPDASVDAGGLPDSGLPDSGQWSGSDGGIWPGFDGGPAKLEVVCASSGWCYSFPYPHGLPVNSIVPDGPNAIWAVSPAAIGILGGTMVHTTGVEQGYTLGPSNGNVQKAVAVDQAGTSGQLWGYGNGAVYLFNGQTWSQVASIPSYGTGACGFDSTHGFMVGGNGMFSSLQADGGWASSLDAGVPGADVFGVSPTDVWAVGGSVVRHYDGNGWSDVAHPALGNGEQIRSVGGSASDDIWFVGGNPTGAGGFFWHWDGQSISPSGVGARLVTHVAAFTKNRAFASANDGIYGWNGSSWSLVHPTRESMTAIYARPNGEVWAGGYDGLILSTADDGGTWHGDVAPFDAAKPLFKTSDQDRFAVDGTGAVMRWSADAGWFRIAQLNYSADGGPALLSAGWGLAADDLWLAGGPSVFRYSGGTWTEMPLPSGQTAKVINGSSNSDVWAGYTNLLHWDGGSWGTYSIGSGWVVAIKTFSPTSAFALTSNALLEWDGGAVGPVGGPASGNAMYAVSPSDIWIVGDYQTMVHFDGNSTTTVMGPNFSADRFQSIVGTGPNDIWAGGYNFIKHYDGGTWANMPPANSYFDHSTMIVTPEDVMASTWRDAEIWRLKR